MRAFFGVIGKQLFLSLGRSWRGPAGTEKDVPGWIFTLCCEGSRRLRTEGPHVSSLSYCILFAKPASKSQLGPQRRQL